MLFVHEGKQDKALASDKAIIRSTPDATHVDAKVCPVTAPSLSSKSCVSILAPVALPQDAGLEPWMPMRSRKPSSRGSPACLLPARRHACRLTGLDACRDAGRWRATLARPRRGVAWAETCFLPLSVFLLVSLQPLLVRDKSHKEKIFKI